jgi:hypothetical protein
VGAFKKMIGVELFAGAGGMSLGDKECSLPDVREKSSENEANFRGYSECPSYRFAKKRPRIRGLRWAALPRFFDV